MSGTGSSAPAPTAKPKRVSWVYSVLPVSLATGSVGTMVQLYIISLNPTAQGIVLATLAVTFYNGVTIPASIFWGYLTDRTHQRKSIIIASYVVMATVLLSFYGQGTAGSIAQYAVFSFVSAASATPLNLLIMENEPKNKWADRFARLSMASGIGNVAGLVLSTVWVQALPLILLAIPFAIASLLSAILSLFMIHEPRYVLEGQTLVLRRPSFFSRLLSLPLIFPNIPSVADFRKVFRGLRYGLTNYVPLLYLSIFCFYLSSGIFNTSFVPALSVFSLSKSEAFGVILAGVGVQTVSFQYIGRFLENRSLAGVTTWALLLRALGYIGIGIFALILAQPLFFVPAIILYPISSGIAFAAYYTASNTMIFNSVKKENPGSSLGVYSGIVGLATLVGSTIPVFASVYLGFDTTFIAAGLVLVVGATITMKLRRDEHPSAVLRQDT